MHYLLEGEQSERLLFRKVTLADFDDWLPFFKNPEIYPFLFLDGTKTERELCSFWLDKILTRYEDGRGGLMALIHKETGTFIGQCGLLVQEIDSQQCLEIGYSLLPQYVGNGYATEAAMRFKELAFKRGHDEQFSNTLVSMIHVNNSQSVQVALRNGMTLQKTFEAVAGQHFHVYGITRSVWENSRKQKA